ncbi:MAG TPA: YceI family protein [Polyangiales bacterium]
MVELQATVHILTFKEGLLAKLAHDLRLTLHDFEITLQAEQVRARFAPASLVVDGVAHADRIDAAALSEHDKHKIQASISDEILQLNRYPHVLWQGRVQKPVDQRYALAGTLDLHGTRLEVPVTMELRDGALHAELALQPSRFGIAPYKALAGAIRLQDRVVVRIALQTGGKTPAQLLATADGVRWTG